MTTPARAATWATGGALIALGLALGPATHVLGMSYATWVWISVVGSVLLGVPVVVIAFARDPLGPADRPPDGGCERTPASWAFVVAVAVALRVLSASADHDLSDDAYRYRWDGKVLAHGINPYAYPPSSAALEELRAHDLGGETVENAGRSATVNHPDLVTVYPPLAEIVFAVAYWLSPGSFLGLDVLRLVAEAAAWWLLAAELRARRLPMRRILFAMWLPLVMTQTYLPGHTEALALPFVALVLRGLRVGWGLCTGIAFGCSLLIKPALLVIAPVLLRELGRRRSVTFVLGVTIVVAGLYAPFVGAGENLVSSLVLMARRWFFNGSLFALADLVMPSTAARLLMGSVVALAAIAMAFRTGDVTRRALVVLAVLFACASTVYPWYLLWLVPFLVLRPDPGLLALVVAMPIVDLVVIDYYTIGVWDPRPWRSVAVYAPAYGLALAGAVRRWGLFARD